MRSALALLAFCIVSATAQAQAPAKDDPFNKYFYPPELVMSHQSEIGLSDEQRKSLRTEVQAAQATFTDIQWKVADEAEGLTRLLARTTVDEAAVLAQVEKILTLEHALKRAQVKFMVRVKNLLSAEQQTKLNGLRGRDD